MAAPTSGPNVSTSGPAYNANGRYYFEAYVWQDPSWNLINSGWLDASQTAAQGYGAGQMAAAQFNSEAMTRVWDQDSSAWLGWQTAGSPPRDAAGNPVTPPASSSAAGPALVVGGFALFAGIAWALSRA